jgi:hypothetical protein
LSGAFCCARLAPHRCIDPLEIRLIKPLQRWTRRRIERDGNRRCEPSIGHGALHERASFINAEESPCSKMGQTRAQFAFVLWLRIGKLREG